MGLMPQTTFVAVASHSYSQQPELTVELTGKERAVCQGLLWSWHLWTDWVVLDTFSCCISHLGSPCKWAMILSVFWTFNRLLAYAGVRQLTPRGSCHMLAYARTRRNPSSPFFPFPSYWFSVGFGFSFGGFTILLSSLQFKFPCVGHSLVVWLHPPHRQQQMGFPFLPLKVPAEETIGPLVFVGVVGAELDSVFKFFDLEESTLFAGAWAALDTAFKLLSNFDSIAAMLATMGLGSQEHKSTFSGEVVKLAALLRAALPFSASTSAAYAACSKLA